VFRQEMDKKREKHAETDAADFKNRRPGESAGSPRRLPVFRKAHGNKHGNKGAPFTAPCRERMYTQQQRIGIYKNGKGNA